MNLVIDTNRVIAALVKDSYSRRILFDERFSFISPDHGLSEVNKYEEEILSKTRLSASEFKKLLEFFYERIELIPKKDYCSFLPSARKLIEDPADEPFVAVALALDNNGIWSDDPHFTKQDKIRVWRTKELSLI